MKPVRIIMLALWMLLASVGAESAHGQCEPQWLPGPALPGVNGLVYCMTSWDPDGPGPRSRVLVVGGNFSIAGGQHANNIAMFDPETGHWSRIGNVGPSFQSASVTSLAVSPNGELLCGGYFFQMEGRPCNGIARWTGSEWLPFGDGLSDGAVNALVFLPNGDLIAGGSFKNSNGVQVPNLARWDGNSWTSIGYCNGTVRAIAVMPSGSLIVGGEFTHAGGVLVNRVAQWDGAAWSSLGSGLPNGFGVGMTGTVRTLTVLQSGELLAGGGFTRAGYANVRGIASWNGTSWQAVGLVGSAPSSADVWAIQALPHGAVAIAGNIKSASNPNLGVIAVWDGVKWAESTDLSPPHYSVTTSIAVLTDGRLVFGMSTGATAQGFDLDGVFAWDGDVWTKLGSGLSASPECVTAAGVGAYVGGSFSHVDGLPVNGIAYWNGVRWSACGEGVSGSTDGYAPSVQAIAVSPTSHDVVVAGRFLRAGVVSAPRIARWDGLQWSAVGNDPNAVVSAVGFLPDGSLVAAGNLATSDGGDAAAVAWLDGSVWRQLGTNLTGSIVSLEVSASGSVFIAGDIYVEGIRTNMACWNGVTWKSIALGFGSTVRNISAIAENLFAAGNFANGVASWTGTDWQSLGFGTVFSARIGIAAASTQECFVAANFSLSLSNGLAKNIARWKSGSWTAMGEGLSHRTDSLQVPDLAWFGGQLYAVGNFQLADDQVSGRFARWTSNPRPNLATVDGPGGVIATATLHVSAYCETGLSSVYLQWQRETQSGSGVFENILDGPSGVSPGGGAVSGASGQLPSPTDGTPATLTITNIQHSDAGMYRVTFWNACGEATSVPVEVKVKAHIADINADGQVDDADFLLFSTQYDLMLCSDPLMPDSCSADFNHDGFVDDADFTIFVPAYNAMLF